MERGGDGSRAHTMIQSSNVAGLTQMQSLSSVVVRPPSLGRSRRFPPHTPPSLPAAELREGGEGEGGREEDKICQISIVTWYSTFNSSFLLLQLFSRKKIHPITSHTHSTAQ